MDGSTFLFWFSIIFGLPWVVYVFIREHRSRRGIVENAAEDQKTKNVILKKVGLAIIFTVVFGFAQSFFLFRGYNGAGDFGFGAAAYVGGIILALITYILIFLSIHDLRKGVVGVILVTILGWIAWSIAGPVSARLFAIRQSGEAAQVVKAQQFSDCRNLDDKPSCIKKFFHSPVDYSACLRDSGTTRDMYVVIYSCTGLLHSLNGTADQCETDLSTYLRTDPEDRQSPDDAAAFISLCQDIFSGIR